MKKAGRKGSRAAATNTKSTARSFEETIQAADHDVQYELRLYVSGTTPKSVRAIRNIKTICEEHLKGRYDLQVIDVYQQPHLARGEQIIAAPTLIKQLPAPLRRLIGDLSDKDRVLLGLDLRKLKPAAKAGR